MDIPTNVRPLCFLGDSLKSIRDFQRMHDMTWVIGSIRFSERISRRISSPCLKLAKELLPGGTV